MVHFWPFPIRLYIDCFIKIFFFFLISSINIMYTYSWLNFYIWKYLSYWSHEVIWLVVYTVCPKLNSRFTEIGEHSNHFYLYSCLATSFITCTGVVVDFISRWHHLCILSLTLHDPQLLLGKSRAGETVWAGLWLELRKIYNRKSLFMFSLTHIIQQTHTHTHILYMV